MIVSRQIKAAVLWTGGKDSALAMREARAGGVCVAELVTFAPPVAKFLAHPISVMRLQAEALGLPHRVVEVREPFAEGYRTAIADLKERHGITRLITGDIDLVDGLPNFVRQCCDGLGVEVLMPLWQRSRRELLDALIAAGFEVILSCVKQPWFTPDWLGRVIDNRCVEDFEQLHTANGLDICGENGEYHTLVMDGPGFLRQIEIVRSVARIQGNLMHLEIGEAILVDRREITGHAGHIMQ